MGFLKILVHHMGIAGSKYFNQVAFAEKPKVKFQLPWNIPGSWKNSHLTNYLFTLKITLLIWR